MIRDRIHCRSVFSKSQLKSIEVHNNLFKIPLLITTCVIMLNNYSPRVQWMSLNNLLDFVLESIQNYSLRLWQILLNILICLPLSLSLIYIFFLWLILLRNEASKKRSGTRFWARKDLWERTQRTRSARNLTQDWLWRWSDALLLEGAKTWLQKCVSSENWLPDNF